MSVPNGKIAGRAQHDPRPSSDSQVHTVCEKGDVVLVCEWPSKPSQDSVAENNTKLLLRVSSDALKSTSTYFAALLDPTKFSEGKRLQEVHAALEAKYGARETALRMAGTDELPHIRIELPPLAAKSTKLEVMEAFIDMLVSVDGSGGVSENASRGPLGRLGHFSVPFLASLAIVSDRLGAVSALKHGLRWSTTSSKGQRTDTMSKIVRRLRSYESGNEERIRQAIYLSLIIDDGEAVRRTTHKLIIQGSREWSSDYPAGYSAGIERALWWRLPHGIEDELCFRHQCILNTIADLQNHFLRVYGALPPADNKLSSRQIQCPRAYENSNACDSFHLGEMIRFFSSRTRTIYLSSSLSNVDVEVDGESDSEYNSPYLQSSTQAAAPSTRNTHNTLTLPQAAQPPQTSAPTNIAHIISSLRQCPEYQIDPNHAGCGIRRRLIPALDYLERFTASQYAPLGVCLLHWKQGRTSWRDSRLADSPVVTVNRSGAIDGVRRERRRDDDCECISGSETAGALFVSRHRRWNL